MTASRFRRKTALRRCPAHRSLSSHLLRDIGFGPRFDDPGRPVDRLW
ncbi:MAG: hypothetical protein KDK01_06305 [Rhodobacteraceae bacterium]|nr:hypothetical protein [Paracoccaceae bacterium]